VLRDWDNRASIGGGPVVRGDVEVRAYEVDGRAVVAAFGDFDVYTAPELRECLEAQILSGHRHIVIDLTGVTFMDSSALGVLVGARKHALRLEGSVNLVCIDDRIVKLFRITGMTQVFAIHASVKDALETV
jgi:anti-sigma B factor antagonist